MTGFEQRSKTAATYHQLLALGRFHEEEFWGTHWFRCCGTGILTRNPAEPWVVMSLRLNIQDFEEELQPNALLASIQCMQKGGKIWNMCMVCQQVLTAKRLERAKNAGKCVVIQSCVCPTPSVPADAFFTKYRAWRHLGRHKHSLRSHGRTNFVEKNSPGGQHPWQTVRQTPQFHGT